jgi:hypothetical protein
LGVKIWGVKIWGVKIWRSLPLGDRGGLLSFAASSV